MPIFLLMTLISGACVGGDMMVRVRVCSSVFAVLFMTAIMYVGGVFIYLAC